MSWIEQHVTDVLSGIWRRKFTEPFSFTKAGSLIKSVQKWLSEFDDKCGYIKETHRNFFGHHRSTIVKAKYFYHFKDIINGLGPGDDDGVEVDYKVGERVIELFPFIHNSFSTIWKGVKDSGVIILPGRDAWVWFVMAKRFGVPAWDATKGEKVIPGVKGVLFDPRISRTVGTSLESMWKIWSEWGISADRCTSTLPWGIRASIAFHPKISEVFVFDTGFEGSVPRGMSEVLTDSSRTKFKWDLFSSRSVRNQLWPSLHEYRLLRKATCSRFPWRQRVIDLENFPKYWVSCELYQGDPLQAENDPKIVVRALAVTLLLCTLNKTFHRTQRPYGGDKVKENAPWWTKAESVQ
jgi:hypothetical protein